MRKLAVIGAVATGMLGVGLTPQAATTDYTVEGVVASGVENNCTNIVIAFNNSDCSWAKNRIPTVPDWSGPSTGAGQYEPGSAGDDVTYRAQAGDAKQRTPITGTLTIDDGGTAADGSDDTISGTFTLEAAARNVTTGNNDYALERWDSITHTITPATFTSATANTSGGFDYWLASKGVPTPQFLRTAANPAQCWPSDDVPGSLGTVGHWAGPVLGPYPDRIGFEGSRVFGAPLVPPPPEVGVPTPNIGTPTTAVITGWECVDDVVGDTDCTAPPDPLPPLVCVDGIGGNEGGADCSGVPTTLPATLLYNNIRGPGFDNVLMNISTNGSGQVTAAYLYWQREYQINAGPAATDTTDENSYSAGLYLLASPGQPLPNGEDPADPTNRPACANWLGGDVVDTQPDPFSLPPPPPESVTPGSVVTSDPVTITGIDAPAPISISGGGGEYSIGCTGTFTATAATVTEGETVCVRLTSSSTPGGTASTTLNVGGVVSAFTVTTDSGGGGGGGGSQIPLPGGSSSLDLLALAALLGGLPLVRRRRS